MENLIPGGPDYKIQKGMIKISKLFF